MAIRWTKRLAWLFLLALLVLVPAQLAHGPTPAQAADATARATAPMTAATPTVCLATLSGLAALAILLCRQLRKSR